MTPMKTLITRLFNEATILTGNPMVDAVRGTLPGNADPRFLECQLVLKNGYAVAGIMTTTPEDTLRLVSPAKKPDNSMIMADHYFDYDDVMTIVIGRDLPRTAGHPSNGNRSPIILGH